jgi:transcriptional regulator with GAF, ATPase, and Fis domain
MGFASRDLSEQQEFEGMFRGGTDLMKMLDLVRTVAHTGFTVLIDGETGTDKKVLGAPFFFLANSEIEPS